MNILEQIKQKEKFSEAEQHIIHFLLMHPEQIIDLSIKELAKQSHTSSSTVTRLVNKLNGNKGFSHFKAAFYSEINNAVIDPEQAVAITSKDTVFSMINKVAVLQTEAVEKTRRNLDHAVIARVFMLLSRSRQICFYGFDDNLNIIKQHLNRMLLLGKQVIVHDETNAQFYQAYSAGKDEAAIMISRTGSNKRLLEIAEILKVQKADVIVITPDAESPLAQYATECIQVESGPVTELVTNITYDTSLQYILNILSGLFYSKNCEEQEKIFESYSKLWYNKL